MMTDSTENCNRVPDKDILEDVIENIDIYVIEELEKVAGLNTDFIIKGLKKEKRKLETLREALT